MSRILVFGGHGKVALLLEPLLASRGDRVDAVIRDPAQSDEVEAAGATPVVFDVAGASVDELADLVRGHDAVVWSAGAGGGSAERTYAVDRDAAIRSMDAAAQAGVRRYVMVSWIGSRADHGVPEGEPFFAYADAKWAADAHLADIGLDATILGPGALTLDEPTGRIETVPEDEADSDGGVARADVAAVIAAVLQDRATIGRTIRFVGGDTPITQALAATAD